MFDDCIYSNPNALLFTNTFDIDIHFFYFGLITIIKTSSFGIISCFFQMMTIEWYKNDSKTLKDQETLRQPVARGHDDDVRVLKSRTVP